jgi:hypothetical protein
MKKWIALGGAALGVTAIAVYWRSRKNGPGSPS